MTANRPEDDAASSMAKPRPLASEKVQMKLKYSSKRDDKARPAKAAPKKRSKTVHSPNEALPRINLGGPVYFAYHPKFLSPAECEQLEKCLAEVPWQRTVYPKYAHFIRTPRLTYTYGNMDGAPEHAIATYRKRQYRTEPIPDWLATLRARCQEELGVPFNAVIVNKYQSNLADGHADDHISWHTDDEQFLLHKTVASITLGSPRVFQVRNDTETHEVALKRGSLAVLHAAEHTIPVRKNQTGIRYNITFRMLKPDSAKGIGNYYFYNKYDCALNPEQG